MARDQRLWEAAANRGQLGGVGAGEGEYDPDLIHFMFFLLVAGKNMCILQKTLPGDYHDNCARLWRSLRHQAGLEIEDVSREFGYSQSAVYRWERGEVQPRAMIMRTLKTMARFSSAKKTGPIALNFIDLFAGIGGLRIGFEGIGGHCVFTSEWDRFSQKTYAENFRDNHPIAGDIRPYADNPELIPEHDVLLAGFPCQPFSIAGVSKKNSLGRPHGFLCDTQGTLFFDTAQIIAHHRPAAFVSRTSKILSDTTRAVPARRS